MNIQETYAIKDPSLRGHDLGLFKITTTTGEGPHIASRFEVITMDGLGLPDGPFDIEFLRIEALRDEAPRGGPRRLTHLRLVNDNAGGTTAQ